VGDDLSRRMALRNNNLPLGRLKKRLWWSRWNGVSRCRKDMRTHFLHPEHPIKRLWWSCLSDVVSRRMALKLIMCLLVVLKTTLVKLMKRCFKVSKGQKTTSSASWSSNQATHLNSLKWCFK
jgi:hypothetical protein